METDINRRALVGGLLSFGALCMVNPVPAFGTSAAQKQAEVRSVKAKLDAMAEDVSAAGDRYHQAIDAYDTATQRVEQAQATIAEASERIASLQKRLDTRATAMYRSGSTSYLDVLLGVRSFEDFATVWDTLNALNAEDADLVADTKVTRSTLEAAQGELVEQQEQAAVNLASAESYMNQVLAKQSEYDRTYNSLSGEYQQILAEQEAAEAQASARAPQEFVPTVVQPSMPAAPSGGASITQDGDDSATPSTPGASSDGSGSISTSTSGGSGAAPSLPTNGSVLDYAYSKIGCPYVWGAKGPDSFDCSGFVAWCYRQIGVSLPSYTESLYACAKARFAPSEARPGDVLYKPGHVGISTGGISCVEAMGTRWGVVESCRGGWTAALRF